MDKDITLLTINQVLKYVLTANLKPSQSAASILPTPPTHNPLPAFI